MAVVAPVPCCYIRRCQTFAGIFLSLNSCFIRAFIIALRILKIFSTEAGAALL
jgi:hypothetical protein